VGDGQDLPALLAGERHELAGDLAVDGQGRAVGGQQRVGLVAGEQRQGAVQAGTMEGHAGLVQVLDPLQDGPAVHGGLSFEPGPLALQVPLPDRAGVGGAQVADDGSHGGRSGRPPPRSAGGGGGGGGAHLRPVSGRRLLVCCGLRQAGRLGWSIAQARGQGGLAEHDRVQVAGKRAEQVQDLAHERRRQFREDQALLGGLVREPVELLGVR
jgi:hypothetical protein